MGTSVQNGIQRVGIIEVIEPREETMVQETSIWVKTEERESIRSATKANMGRSMQNDNSIHGHLFLGLRNVVEADMKMWPCNKQLLGRGPLQRTDRKSVV